MSKYYLSLDENNYLLSVATVGGGIEADIDLSNYDLSDNRILAHKWDGKSLVFDADRYAEIETEKEAQQSISNEPTETEQLRADIDYLAIMTGVEL